MDISIFLVMFTPPDSFDTPEITLAEEEILQAQEGSFIEISVDQYNVFELNENSNCIVDDVKFVSAVQVFYSFTISVFYCNGIARNFVHRAPLVKTRSLGFISFYKHSP